MLKFIFHTIYIFRGIIHVLRFSSCVVQAKSYHALLIADAISFPDIQLPWIRIFDLGIMQKRVWWEFVSLCLILVNYKKQTITSIGLFYKNVGFSLEGVWLWRISGGILTGDDGAKMLISAFRSKVSISGPELSWCRLITAKASNAVFTLNASKHQKVQQLILISHN